MCRYTNVSVPYLSNLALVAVGVGFCQYLTGRDHHFNVNCEKNCHGSQGVNTKNQVYILNYGQSEYKYKYITSMTLSVQLSSM